MSEYIDFEIYQINPGKGITKATTCEPAKLKCILLLAQDDPETIAFLTKIMSSVDLSITNECNTFILDEAANIGFEDIFKNGHANRIICFGINKSVFNTMANIKLREWNNFESFSLLLFDKLREINGSNDMKRKLWDQIKILKSD